MYPETTYTFEGHQWATWATAKDRFGFSCGGEKTPPLTVNSVEYRVRLHAVPDPESGAVVLKGEVFGTPPRTRTSYNGTVYIKRAGASYVGNSYGNPTESAERKIIELAHRLIAGFLSSDEGAALMEAGHRHDTIERLRRTRKTLEEATNAKFGALLDYHAAADEARRIGNVPMENFA